MASLSLKNIYKEFDKNVVVKDFNLEIKDKEFIVLVGPSGCGKSTTLRMIAGLEEITSGELYIGDRLVNDVQPKNRDIAMVFQNYALYPHMTVYENMAFALKLRKIKKEEIEARVKTAAKILGIEEYLTRKPKKLSGGQRQRVAIGRAIVRNPQVFLMDEPLSNLDAKLRNQMRAELIKLHKELNTTFIYVTHDQVEAMTLGTRIVVMKDGVIQQVGTPHEIFEKPYNCFVAGFIGTPQMNFFEDCDLILKDGKYMVKMFEKTFTLGREKQELLKAKGASPCKVIAGIRPEDVEVVQEADAGALNACIDVSELMGSEIHMHVNIKNEEYNCNSSTANAVIRVKASAAYENIDTIKIRPLEDKIHLFDPKTQISMIY